MGVSPTDKKSLRLLGSFALAKSFEHNPASVTSTAFATFDVGTARFGPDCGPSGFDRKNRFAANFSDGISKWGFGLRYTAFGMRFFFS